MVDWQERSYASSVALSQLHTAYFRARELEVTGASASDVSAAWAAARTARDALIRLMMALPL
jgi:hypothetical protein